MYKALVASAQPGEGAQMHAFGINLSDSAWSALTKGLGFAEIVGSLFLLLIMIGANYYQQVQITNLNPMVRQNQQMNSQMQIMRFSIVFGLICIRLPSGLVIYYAVSALFRVGQQWMMYHYDPKVIALVAKDDRDIGVMEARLEETERKKPKPQGKPQQLGPSQTKSSQSGQGQSGQGQSGQGQSGQGQSGQGQSGQGQSGQGQSRPPQAGQGRSGQAQAKPTQPKTPQTGASPAKPPQADGAAQGKTSPARMPQVKQPKPLPPSEDGAPTDGKTNGQVANGNPSPSASGQGNRSRRRKGR